MKKAFFIIIICFILVGCNDKSSTNQEKNNTEKQVTNSIIAIPDVTNMDEQTAKSKLEEEGFKVEIEYEESTEYSKNNAIKTNPSVGTKQSKGSTIKLYISSGTELFTIADYTGENYLKAKSTLEKNGIRVIVEKTNLIDDLYEENVVANQSIAAGEKISVGDTITLYIPDIVSAYPDFTNNEYTLSEVTEFCDKHGVNLKVEQDETAASGVITYQSSEPGSKIIKGSTITIKIGQ